ncbi:MAG TPA: helix-hairpin-helix domain-containing protein [Candidatus Polarisedimenticolaceae bacterium]|nr:helix-hairpin-helix domain-containing protein [Candidatus Polarisedimenticolaceae bacterium]
MLRSSRIVPILVFALALPLLAWSAPSRASAPAAAHAASQDLRPVDINTATSADLEAVPGIGKSLASRILAFREKNGAYGSVDDLLKIQGIGEKSLEKLRPYLVVAKAK